MHNEAHELCWIVISWLSAQVLGFRVYPPRNSEEGGHPGIFPPAHASTAVQGGGEWVRQVCIVTCGYPVPTAVSDKQDTEWAGPA